jgi:glucans biosynthesis protein C
MTIYATNPLVSLTEPGKNKISKSTVANTTTKVARLFYIDNVRIFLTLLVVVHHIAVGYGGGGDWGIKETPSDSISPILLTLFNILNQSFFMSLFFLLSGFFVPGAYDKKGPVTFIKDRFIRLGIPTLAYTAVISPFITYIILNFSKGREISFYQVIISYVNQLTFDTGPLWFIEALLLFCLVYAGYRLLVDRFLKNLSFVPFKNTFPSVRSIVISIVIIALGTYLVRTWYPIGTNVYHFQIAHWVHYVFCFWLGTMAYRGRWQDHLTAVVSKPWRNTALVVVICLPLWFGFVMAAGYTVEEVMGGGTWVSFAYAAWESIACLSISIWILFFFKSRFNTQNRLAKTMSLNAYTVYIIHAPVIMVVMAFFLAIGIPSFVKFIIVVSIGVPLCLLASHFIFRKIPFSKKVLG